MGRNEWWSVRVELVSGGMAGELWPRPGKIFAVDTWHTLHVLAEAIDDAFGRWNRAHLHEFYFPATGKRAIEHRYIDVEDSADALDADRIRVADVLALGQEFSYTFDLGDNWRHHCQVGQQPIDPDKELGLVPDRPRPYWGWGIIPDPYGRTWDGDDGRSPVQSPPNNGHGPTPPAHADHGAQPQHTHATTVRPSTPADTHPPLRPTPPQACM